MTDQLRKLAEAEAAKRWGAPDPAIIHPSPMDRMDNNMRREYIEGFIAGRTSVTQADLAKVIDRAIYVSINPLLERGSWKAAQRAAREVLALLNGENDDWQDRG